MTDRCWQLKLGGLRAIAQGTSIVLASSSAPLRHYRHCGLMLPEIDLLEA